MSESIELSPLGLSSLPPALRAQFDAELHHAHEVLWAEREAFEDLAGRGCTLQHQSGVVSATVTLTVRVDLVVESGSASLVGQVQTTMPKRKSVRLGLIPRPSGFYTEVGEPEQERLPLGRPNNLREVK